MSSILPPDPYHADGTVENQKGIENHHQAAIHFEAAAKNHLQAAMHHQQGNHLEAFKSTLLAQGQNQLGIGCQNEDMLHHILND